MSGSNEEARALRVMIDELRAEEPPALRWDAIERSLMLEVARRERARIGRSGAVMESTFGRVFAFAAAAAMLALGVSSMTQRSALPAPSSARAASSTPSARPSPASPRASATCSRCVKAT